MSPGVITQYQLEHCLTAPLSDLPTPFGIRGCKAAASRHLRVFRCAHCREYARAVAMCARLYTRSLRAGYSNILCEYYRRLHYNLECGRLAHALDTSFVDKWEATVFGEYNDTVGAFVTRALECSTEPDGDEAMQVFVIGELRGIVW